jgi:hypothetical protein
VGESNLVTVVPCGVAAVFLGVILAFAPGSCTRRSRPAAMAEGTGTPVARPELAGPPAGPVDPPGDSGQSLWSRDVYETNVGSGWSPRPPHAGAAAVPSVVLGEAALTGSLDAAIIRRYIRRHLEQIRACFARQLVASPELAGTTTVAFVVAGDGKVTSSSANGLGVPELEACVAAIIKTIEFPKTPDGGAVEVRYPFNFQPPSHTKPTSKPTTKLED